MSRFTKFRDKVVKVAAAYVGVPPQVVDAGRAALSRGKGQVPQGAPVVAAVETPATIQGTLNNGLKNNQTMIIGGAAALAIIGMLVIARK